MRRAAPAVFVLLWSTGFVVARYATNDAGAMSFLAVRTLIAACLLAVVASVNHEDRISSAQRTTMVVVGAGMHAMYLGGVFYAIGRGMPSGMSALIAALHPVLTAVLGWMFLGERLNRVRAAGIILGGLGVVLVVAGKGGTSGTVPGDAMLAMGASVVGMSIGTLVQRRHGAGTPLLKGTAWQYVSAAVLLGAVAVAGEGWRFESTLNTWLAMAWAVGVLSVAAVLIMLWLLHRQAASQVGSLFFLTPALSAAQAAVLFGESFGALSAAGMGVGLVGVWFATAERFLSAPQR